MATPIHSASADRLPPRLDIRGPVALGLAIVLVFFGAGLGTAALVPIDKGASLGGIVIVESKVKSVQHQKGGIVGKVHVAQGAEVKAGDVIVSLDTAAIDEQIAALSAQSKAAMRQLDLIREEAATLNGLLAKQLAQRSRVLALERQVAEVEKEAAGFSARIALAEQELAKAAIRAPVGGRLLTLSVHGPGEVIGAGATIAEIVPQDERLVIEGRLSPALIDLVKPGQASKVWLNGSSWREARPLAAKVAWVSPDTVEDKRTGMSFFLVRIELALKRSDIAARYTIHPGQRTEILVLTGERTLLDQLMDPIVRNINRAFRA